MAHTRYLCSLHGEDTVKVKQFKATDKWSQSFEKHKGINVRVQTNKNQGRISNDHEWLETFITTHCTSKYNASLDALKNITMTCKIII